MFVGAKIKGVKTMGAKTNGVKTVDAKTNGVKTVDAKSMERWLFCRNPLLVNE